MECYKAGEILILPVEGGTGSIENLLHEDKQLTIKYSFEDIISYYELRPEKRFASYPFIAGVPEGKELEYAEKIRNNKKYIKASIPNFLIKPSSESIKINRTYIDKKIKALDCLPSSSSCGGNVRVAIIDTGVNGSELPHFSNLHPNQYSTDKPERNTKPIDLYGHGTAVAYIINSIAPAATLYSIKMMDDMGNIGGLILALYLAEINFMPDIYNLSLSITCNTICEYCFKKNDNVINVEQIEMFFSFLNNKINNKTHPLIIAAAGNQPPIIEMPACFDNILAVGSYENKHSIFNSYNNVDPNLFILAPGGIDDSKQCIGYKNSFNQNKSFKTNEFGTSFSTAFVTGIAARYLCSCNKNNPCFNGIKTNTKFNNKDFILECLRKSASRKINKFNRHVHGMGLAQYDQSILGKINLKNYF